MFPPSPPPLAIKAKGVPGPTFVSDPVPDEPPPPPIVTATGVAGPTAKLGAGTRTTPPAPPPPPLLLLEFPPPPPPAINKTPAVEVVGLDVKVPGLVKVVVKDVITLLSTPITPPFPLAIVNLPF
jgi:hypothetical protein